jgi:mono/diheme cytochrome c family protein
VLARWIAAAFALHCAGTRETAAAADPEPGRLFNAQIRSLLEQKCVQCHGPEKQKGGLRLDSREAALKGNEHGPAIRPGDPSGSRLLEVIESADPQVQMPPKERLGAGEIGALRKWVAAGAPWPAPVAVLFEDEEALLTEFRSGKGQIRLITDDVHAGKAALSVTPLQREAANIPGWRFEIREHPGPGQYRFLRFAWKKRGGGSALLEIAASGRWPDARSAAGRYVAGVNTTGWAAKAVAAEAPGEWTVVVCDLWKDMGDFTLTGIAPTCDKGSETLFDSLILGRDPESLASYAPGQGTVAYADPNRKVGDARTDPENPVRKVWRGERLDLWSFQKPVRVGPPAQEDRPGPIDAFLLDALRREGLRFSPEAPPGVLLRRLRFDLLGLPPAEGEVAEFEAACRGQGTDAAYAAWVERYLAHPAYGERWARYWLDVVRYADTNGHERDEFRPDMWRYRDYVVEAFRRDKPYDEFVREQLAGDARLQDPKGHPGSAREMEGVIATGFLRLGLFDSTAPIFQEQKKAANDWMADVVNTTASAFLGLTFSCCNCHDHKYDPLTQTDHFRMRAFFAGMSARDDLSVETPETMRAVLARTAELDEKARDLERQMSGLLTPARTKLRAEKIGKLPAEARAYFASGEEHWDAQTRRLAEPFLERVKVSDKEALDGSPGEIRDEHARLRKEAEAVRKTKPSYQKAVGVVDGTPETVHLLFQGDITEPKEPVAPGLPSFFEPAPATIPAGGTRGVARRAFLADWIASGENPFTARVMVNRIWMHHFGSALFSNPNDLGYAGGRPTHPELLDWLATEFVAGKWSIKNLHRLIVTSRAYRQGSADSAAGRTRDPDNRLYWRQNVRRLDAETLRDAMLASSGLLRERAGGRPLWPPLPEEILRAQPGVLEALEGKDSGRRQGWFTDPEQECDVRTLYLVQKRSIPLPFLQAFDLPDSSVSCARRDVTTVAPQALNLLNSEFTLRCATAMAETCASGEDAGRFIRRVIERAFGRDATAAEVESARTFLLKTGTTGRLEFCRAMLNANEFVYID